MRFGVKTSVKLLRWRQTSRLISVVRDVSDPIQIVCYSHVDPWNSKLSASNTPADDAHNLPGTATFTHHGTTTITLQENNTSCLYNQIRTYRISWSALEVLVLSKLQFVLASNRLQSPDSNLFFWLLGLVFCSALGGSGIV